MKAALEPGAAVRFRDNLHVVVGYEKDGRIRLRDGNRIEQVVEPAELTGDATYRVEQKGEEGSLSPLQAFWDALDDAERGEAIRREEALQEVLTGYRLGKAVPRFPGEPREAYREGTTLEARIEAKAAELGRSARQVKRWLSDYRKANHHPAGLVDGHAARPVSQPDASGRKIIDALLSVARERTDDSDITFTRLRELVRRKLEATGSPEVQLPSQPTFNGLVRRYAPELTHHAKRRRSDASRGVRCPFGKAVAVRPGQFVLIDITPFDILARSEVDGRELRMRMAIAMDLYSRAIVGIRVVEVEPKGVDLSMLLLNEGLPSRTGGAGRLRGAGFGDMGTVPGGGGDAAEPV